MATTSATAILEALSVLWEQDAVGELRIPDVPWQVLTYHLEQRQLTKLPSAKSLAARDSVPVIVRERIVKETEGGSS